MTLMNINKISSNGGTLTFIDNKTIPFDIKRVFYMYYMEQESIRGNHAHIKCQQFIIPISGSFNIEIDNGKEKVIYMLDKPNEGVHIPILTWVRLYNFSQGSVCLVLASEEYSIDDYIFDYTKFIEAANENRFS